MTARERPDKCAGGAAFVSPALERWESGSTNVPESRRDGAKRRRVRFRHFTGPKIGTVCLQVATSWLPGNPGRVSSPHRGLRGLGGNPRNSGSPRLPEGTGALAATSTEAWQLRQQTPPMGSLLCNQDSRRDSQAGESDALWLIRRVTSFCRASGQKPVPLRRRC